MSESQVENLDGLTSALAPDPMPSQTPSSAPAARKVGDWPLVRPLRTIASSIRDTVNCSLDAVRGRYDM